MQSTSNPPVSTTLLVFAWVFVAGAIFGRFAHRVLVPPPESPHYFVLVAPVTAAVAFLWSTWLLLLAAPAWRSLSAVRLLSLLAAFLLSCGLLALMVGRA